MRRGFEMRDETLAYALLRVTVGLNFMMHGVSRLLAGPAVFAEKLVTQFAHAPLPGWSVQAFASALPFVEGALGLLLLLGLRTKWVLIALSLVMLALTFGTTLLQDWSGPGRSCCMSLCWRRCCSCGGSMGGRWMPGWGGSRAKQAQS